MAKSKPADKDMPDLSHGLEQLGETTTAGELLRSKGQSKKLRVITEKKLMDWILSLINQHMASKADAFSDQEKDDLLKQAKEELNRRIKREQDAQAERDKAKEELELAMAKVAEVQSSNASAGQMKEAMATLKAKLEESEQGREDLQLEIYDLHDQLDEKMKLASTTIAEKEQLEKTHREAMKSYMLHAHPLIEGVLTLDNDLYGSRHAEENPVPDDADNEASFYNDYDVAAKVVETLAGDLQRMRAIAKNAAQKDAARSDDPRMNLLESDLQLLEQLKGGSLSAVDVAEPIESLVEAMNGARTEAQQLEHMGKEALGVAAGREDAIAAVPDSDSGEPAEILAGTMGVARELAAVIARGKQRISALKEMADQADEARNSAEQELQELREAYMAVLGKLAERAKEEKLHVPFALMDEDAPPEESRNKAIGIIEQITGGGGGSSEDAAPVIKEQILLIDEILGHDAGVHMAPPADDADQAALTARLREDSEALARLVKEKSEALAKAAQREQAIAKEVQALAKTKAADIAPDEVADDELNASISNLSQAIDNNQEDDVASAAQQVIAHLREQLAKAPSSAEVHHKQEEIVNLNKQLEQAQQRNQQLEAALANAKAANSSNATNAQQRARAERDMAKALVDAAKGDQRLAESVADLALVADSAEDENLAPALSEAVTGLVRRKQDLSEENERLANDLKQAKAKLEDTEKRVLSLNSDQDRNSAELTQAQQRAQDLERDLSRAKTDLDLMRNQAQEANSKRSAVETELNKTKAQLDTLNAQLAEAQVQVQVARSELEDANARAQVRNDGDRAIATELVRAAQGDDELAENTADLALSLEDTSESASPMESEALTRQAASTIALLAQRKQELGNQVQALQQERDALKSKLKEAEESATSTAAEQAEFAESVKVINAQLTQQRERDKAELNSVKEELSSLEDKYARMQHRTSAAETANRQLAEALSSLASLEKDQGANDVEDKRVDLELALSQLPDEGEEDVSIPDDLSLQLASSGQKLAESLLARRQHMTSTFKRAKEDQESLKSELNTLREKAAEAEKAQEELQTSLRSSQAEVKAVRAELTSQGRDLAAKIQDLTDTRGEIASIKAELDVAAQSIEEKDRRLADRTAELQELKSNHERAMRDLSEQQQRADAADHAQSQLVQLLRSLTNRQDEQPVVARALTDPDMADPLSMAAQKLDMASSAGPEQLAAASQNYVHALKERVQSLAEELEDQRGQLTASKGHEDSLQGELANIRAMIVDREHQLQNSNDELAKAKAEHAELINQQMETTRERDEIAAQLKKTQEELRMAQAEVDDYHARDGASSGSLSSDLERVRAEVEQERSQREAREEELSELKESLEAAEARLKAQREEFTRRLADRDHTIEQKEAELNTLAEERADSKGLQAHIEALTKERDTAKTRIRELEEALGATAGSSAKSTDIARELKNKNAELEKLREKLRDREVELADNVSMAAQYKSQLEEVRKDVGSNREKVAKERADMRQTVTAKEEENRKLKEELAGLRARLRRLTDNSSGPSGGFPTNS